MRIARMEQLHRREARFKAAMTGREEQQLRERANRKGMLVSRWSVAGVVGQELQTEGRF